MAAPNTDDHLRNHAFMLKKDGWVLSPLFDINPLPYGDELSLLVDEEDITISIGLAVRTAPRFGISEKEAKKIADQMLSIVRDNWTNLASKYGLPRSQIEAMRPAFSACYE